MRTKHTFRLPPELARQLADYAGRKRLHQAFVVETALASFLSPDNSERMEAALGKRLDRLTRQVERLERHVTISNEAIALFVRFWLTATSPVPDAALPAAQAKGRERYERFVEALGRRLAKGQSLAQEISLDAEPQGKQSSESRSGVIAYCRSFLLLRQTTIGILSIRPSFAKQGRSDRHFSIGSTALSKLARIRGRRHKVRA